MSNGPAKPGRTLQLADQQFVIFAQTVGYSRQWLAETKQLAAPSTRNGAF